MNIEDNSTFGYWTNNTANNEDLNGSLPFTYNTSVSDANYFATFEEYSLNDTNSAMNSDSNWQTWLRTHNPNATANSTSIAYTQTNLPGTRTWPMWMFWTVACSLVLGSIVVPVIGGRVFRECSHVCQRAFQSAYAPIQPFIERHKRILRTCASFVWIG
jgi:hypothetical protein